YDDGIRMSLAGNAVIGCRMEINNRAIVVGLDETGTIQGTSGFQITGCTFESDTISICVLAGGPGAIIGVRSIGGAQAPFSQSKYGVELHGAGDCSFIGNLFAGGYCGAAFYQTGQGSGTFIDNIAQARLSPDGIYTAGQTDIGIQFGTTGLTLPLWVVDGLT